MLWQGIGADECKMNAQIMEYSNDLSILVFYRHKKWRNGLVLALAEGTVVVF